MRLFDTDFIVNLTNEDKGAGALAAKIDQERSFSAVSVISVHEYLFGVHYAYRKDQDRLRAKLASAKKDLSRFEVVPLSEAVAELSAKLQAELESRGTVIGINDIYIGATALHYRLRLVTRNVEHFRRISTLKVETY